MNIPNALSIFRLALVPVFIIVFFSDTPYAYAYAAGIFALAGATDVLDGRIARKFNQITMLGRILDPLADKLIVFSALICLTLRQSISPWICVAFFVKEAVQGIGGLILFRKIRDVPPSNLLGKVATFLFFGSTAAIILFDGIAPAVKTAMLSAALAVVVLAFFSYLLRALRLVRELRAQDADRAADR